MPNRSIVLIVDDVPSNVNILAHALRSDYVIKVANNGIDALVVALQEPPPDVILLDVMMPEMDGFEVCRRLKEDPRTQKIPVIFITAKSDSIDEERGFNLGATDYITKPFSIPIARARIKNHIQYKLQNQLLEEEASEHKCARERLFESESRLNYALEAAELGAWKFDLNTQSAWRSELHGKIFGCQPPLPEWNYSIFLDQVLSEDRKEVQHKINESTSKALPLDLECRIHRQDGSVRWISMQGKPEFDDHHQAVGFYGVIQDITERKFTQDALQLAAMVYNNSNEAMLVADADNRIVAVNPAFTRLTGYSQEEIIGQKPNILNSGRQDKDFYQVMWRSLLATGSWHGEVWNRRKDGSFYAEWLTINTIYNAQGGVHQRIALIADITEKKKSDELIWRQANFDPLTQLPNRRLFRDRLEQSIKKAHRDQQALALFFIDLDHFKEVNDTLGHDMGDLLLIEAAKRISACVREVDTVARLGGDEFTIILTELEDQRGVERIAQEINKKLAESFSLDGETTYISASIGITLYPNDALNAEALIKNADQAMYAAKNLGRNRNSYFTESMQEAAMYRLHLISELRCAIAEGQLEVYFQPIVNLSTGRIIKAEALLRWNHPHRGLVMPGEFISIAEECGLINSIGDWVFKESASLAQLWMVKHGSPFQISINMSPLQFQAGADYTHWLDLLDKLNIPGECIVIEITEGVLLHNDENVEKQLLLLRNAGIKIAIDDFGTGYSALSYLKNFDIDYLKIDQSFVRDLCFDQNDLALCEAIIVMAGKLGLKVIAEGIETSDQKSLLINAGCDIGQGYLFSKPMTADAFERFLKINHNQS